MKRINVPVFLPTKEDATKAKDRVKEAAKKVSIFWHAGMEAAKKKEA